MFSTVPQPIVLVWISSIVVMVLILIVLIEISRNNRKREKEVMFGTELFEQKCIEHALSEKERHTMDKLVRRSVYSNKDALFNSVNLFEDAVNRFYEFRSLDSIRDITLDSVSGLRRKLGFTIANPGSQFVSTRQLEPETFLKVRLSDGKEIPLTVSNVDEKIFRLKSDSVLPEGITRDSVLAVRWTRPGDAIYTARCEVRAVSAHQIEFFHGIKIDKFQLRRWVREMVDFEAVIDYCDGRSGFGHLLDLSAGGILVGLDCSCEAGQEIYIDFELPSYGRENVKIRLLRNLGKKNEKYPNLFLHSAEFCGEFGWTQEKVLQYIFEVRRRKNIAKNVISA